MLKNVLCTLGYCKAIRLIDAVNLEHAKANEKSLFQATKLFWHSLSIFDWYTQTNNILKAVLLWISFHSYMSLQNHLCSLLWNFLLFPILAIGTRPKATSGACQDPDAKPWNILVATSGLLVSYTGSCAVSSELPLGMSHSQTIYWYVVWVFSEETFVFLLTINV